MLKKTIKRTGLVGVIILVITALFFWDTVFADLPKQIFFQARMKKADNTTLSGNHNLIFRLYLDSTGGSNLWSETQALTADASGIVSCYLGSATNFPSTLDFNSAYYLSIEVDSDGEMSPRIKIVPSPSALNSDRFDGLDSLQFLRSDTADTMEAPFTLTNYLDQNYTGTAADAININYSPSSSASYNALDITAGSNVTGNTLKITHSGSGSGIYVASGRTWLAHTPTATKPALLISTESSPGFSTSTATQLVLSQASGGTYNLIDAQIGGSSKFSVDVSGNLTLAGGVTNSGDQAITGNLTVKGNTTLGDASGDSVTVNAGTFNFVNPVTTSLNNVANAWNIDSGTLSIDALNNRVGIGTTLPEASLSFATAVNAAGGIDFGGDTNLYRSAANTLTTDDSLVVTGSLSAGSLSSSGDLDMNSHLILNIGSTDTDFIAGGGLTLAGDLAVNGGDITSTTALTLQPSGNLTLDALNAAANSTITLTNTNATYAANVNLSDGSLQTAGTSRLTNAGALENITGFTQTSGNFDMSGTGAYSQTYTGTATPMTITADSMTTGSGISISADALSSGNGIAVDSTSTAFAGKLLNLTASGAANATTRYGVYSSLTGAGTTSTNVAGYFNAQNGTTANYGLIVENGNVGIGTTAPAAKLNLAEATTAAGGILFGSDTNLYRSAANTLTTDDSLAVTGSLSAGSLSSSGDLDMNSHLILNIGSTSTDFTSGGGLTLAGDLAVNGNTILGSDATDTVTINAGPIKLVNATAAADALEFGSGTNLANLYLSANDTLKTDDALIVSGNLDTLSGLDVTGTTNLGDGGTTNYLSVSNTGDITFYGTADTLTANSGLTINTASNNSLTFDPQGTGDIIQTLDSAGSLATLTKTVTLTAAQSLNENDLSLSRTITKPASGTATLSSGYVLDIVNNVLGAGAGSITTNSTGTLKVQQLDTTSTGTALLLNQAGSGNILDIQDAGTSVFTILDGGDITLGSGADIITAPSASDLNIRLGDALGARKFVIQDSAGAEVASIDSDGKLKIDGGYTGTSGGGITLEPDGDIYFDGDIYQTGTKYEVSGLRFTGNYNVGLVSKFGVGADGTDTDYLQIDADGWLSDNDDPVTINDALSQLGSANQVTFAGNVDATNGLDVTTAALTTAAGLTVSGGNISFSTLGTINQSGTGLVTFAGNVDANAGLDVIGNLTSTLAAANSLTIDAATTDNTTTTGILNLDVDSSTNNNAGIDLNYESLLTNATGTQANTALSLSPVQGSTGVGGTHLLYGVYIQDLTPSGTPSGTNTEYGLRIGTGYDYAALLESDTYIATGTYSFGNPSGSPDLYVQGNLEVDGTIYGTVSSSSGTFEDLTVNGNTILGSDATDTVTINAGPIKLVNATAAADALEFGSGTNLANLYLSANDTLKTDDALDVEGALDSGSLSIDAGSNFDMSAGSGTFATGTGAVSLNGDTTIAANKSLSFTSGTGTYSQAFSGTTQTPLLLTSTFSPTAGGTQYAEKLSITNSPVTSANTLYGKYISFTDAGSLANTITGLYVDVTTANATDTTYAAIFQGGNVGIGTTSPTALLHLKAGTATASTAPLKFTSGTLLTTAEAGAIEFLTDAYYGTITAGAARKTFAFTDSNITGNSATVTVADAGGDTTTWPLLGTGQTGSLAPATDAGLTYNATTDTLTATTFVGALTGNASTVTTNANLTGGVTSVGNAATVVTNANLTGPITSSGNTTSVAAQTGTGSTFVMQAGPTFTGSVTMPGTGIWNSSGYVGIGTTSVTGALDVRGDEVRIWTGVGTDTNATAAGELYVEGDLEVDATSYLLNAIIGSQGMSLAGAITQSNGVTGQNNFGGSLVPTSNNAYFIGTASLKWSDMYATTFHGALSAGDVTFQNNFKITEEGDNALAFINPLGVKILVLDKEGNLFIRGEVKKLN